MGDGIRNPFEMTIGHLIRADRTQRCAWRRSLTRGQLGGFAALLTLPFGATAACGSVVPSESAVATQSRTPRSAAGNRSQDCSCQTAPDALPSPTVAWARRIAGPFRLQSAAVDSAGNLVMAGCASLDSGSVRANVSPCPPVLKLLSRDGILLGEAVLPFGGAQVTALAASDNRIVAAGSFSGLVGTCGAGGPGGSTSGPKDAFILELDGNLACRWVSSWGGPGADRVQELGLQPDGRILACGVGREPAGSSDSDWCATFDAGGHPLHSARILDGGLPWVIAPGENGNMRRVAPMISASVVDESGRVDPRQGSDSVLIFGRDATTTRLDVASAHRPPTSGLTTIIDENAVTLRGSSGCAVRIPEVPLLARTVIGGAVVVFPHNRLGVTICRFGNDLRREWCTRLGGGPDAISGPIARVTRVMMLANGALVVVGEYEGDDHSSPFALGASDTSGSYAFAARIGN